MTVGVRPRSRRPPKMTTYPAPVTTQVYDDVVGRLRFSKPVRAVTAQSSHPTDTTRHRRALLVNQKITAPYTYVLFPSVSPHKCSSSTLTISPLVACRSPSADNFRTTKQDLFSGRSLSADDPKRRPADTALSGGLLLRFGPPPSPRPPPFHRLLSLVLSSHFPSLLRPRLFVVAVRFIRHAQAPLVGPVATRCDTSSCTPSPPPPWPPSVRLTSQQHHLLPQHFERAGRAAAGRATASAATTALQ